MLAICVCLLSIGLIGTSWKIQEICKMYQGWALWVAGSTLMLQLVVLNFSAVHVKRLESDVYV